MIRLSTQKELQGAGGRLYLETDFLVEKGQFICLYGKSGAGKTSILRMIAGLLNPDAGILILEHKMAFENGKIRLKPQERNIAFVFQDYALFPHLSILENLRFAQKNQKDETLIQELLSLIELETLANQKPNQLSGGQQQRVALARAIAQKPRILLLDEALSALDEKTREKMQDVLLNFHQKLALTTIMVSHDIPEIIKLSDRVIGLKNGKIAFDESPSQAFSKEKKELEAKVLELIPRGEQMIIKAFFQQNILEFICSPERLGTIKKGTTIKLKIKDNQILML